MSIFDVMHADTTPTRALIIENFHPKIKELLSLALSSEASFKPVLVEEDGIFPRYLTNSKDYRAVGISGSKLNDLMLPMIKKIVEREDEILSRFKMKKLYFKTPQLFMTRMGDGDLFKRHSDYRKISGPNFELVFLLYFYSEPKAFSGGELELFWKDGIEVISTSNNTLVIFPGPLEHAVRMVSCPSKKLIDSRFVVVGRFCAPLTILQLSAKLIRGATRSLYRLLKKSAKRLRNFANVFRYKKQVPSANCDKV